MKKRVTAILVALLLLMQTTVASAALPDISALTDEEKAELLHSLSSQVDSTALNEALLEQIGAYSDETLASLAEAVAAEQAKRGVSYNTLQHGSRGEEVRTLQLRLIELSYLSGSADGDFGNKTANAVKLFQQEVGISATGIADPATQKALFAEDAPEATVYLSLDYNAISRDPDDYTGKKYTFTGKIVQVMEGDGLIALRIATKGGYDNVVYVIYAPSEGESRLLEDDYVTVYGTSQGLETYETVIGGSVTIPLFYASSVTRN